MTDDMQLIGFKSALDLAKFAAIANIAAIVVSLGAIDGMTKLGVNPLSLFFCFGIWLIGLLLSVAGMLTTTGYFMEGRFRERGIGFGDAFYTICGAVCFFAGAFLILASADPISAAVGSSALHLEC